MPRTFPFATVRKGQKDFLADALKAVSEGKHLLAQAPTGLGKTAVALAASLEGAIKQDKLVLFLTSRQTQHRIVIDTLREIERKFPEVKAIDIVSKQSMCPQPHHPSRPRAFQEYCELMTKSRSCRYFNHQDDAIIHRILERPQHVQDMQTLCAKKGVCPHKAALEAATQAHALVCDYNYMFSRQREAILARLDKSLSEVIVVVDEAHNLPDRIRSQLCGDLRSRQLVRGAKEARRIDGQLASVLWRMTKQFDAFLSRIKGERRVKPSQLNDMLEAVSGGGPWNLEILAETCSRIGAELASKGMDTVLLDIANFLAIWQESGPWMVHVATGGDEGHLGYRLLDPSVLSREVFAKIHSSILMSGTLHPGGMYADLLGLEKERLILKEYPSPFPPENRLAVVTPHLTTLFRKRDDSMMRALAKEVAAITKSCPGNLAAFFPSYSLLARVAEKMCKMPINKQIIAESPDWDKIRRDRALVQLTELKGNGGGLLLGVLGGSFSEGIDFRDNLLSCVIIGGLPISPPTVEVRALNDYYAHKFDEERGYQYAYIYPAINKILQAAGRCIRSEKDRAVVAILDERLLMPRYHSCLPKGFEIRSTNCSSEEVRTFFYGGSHRQGDALETRSGSRVKAG